MMAHASQADLELLPPALVNYHLHGSFRIELGLVLSELACFKLRTVEQKTVIIVIISDIITLCFSCESRGVKRVAFHRNTA